MNMHIRLIDTYIGREILLSWLMVLLILLAVVTSTETVHLLSWVANGRISGQAVMPLLLNGILNFSVMLIPLSLLLGILLAYGRLYKDSEMTAFMSAGLGPLGWYRPLLMVAVPVSLLLLLMMLFVSPLVSQQRDVLINAEKNRAEHTRLMAGRFNASKQGDAIFFIESQSSDRSEMQNVFQRYFENEIEHVDIAPSAVNRELDGRDYMLMQNGRHYIGTPGNNRYQQIEYTEYGVYLPQQNNDGVSSEVASYSLGRLWGSEDSREQAELQWRITVPIATFMICLLALPLSYTTPRSGRYAKLALAILMYLVYSNLLGVGKTWLAQDKVPVWIGTWWVHLIALAVLLLLFWQRGYFYRRTR